MLCDNIEMESADFWPICFVNMGNIDDPSDQNLVEFTYILFIFFPPSDSSLETRNKFVTDKQLRTRNGVKLWLCCKFFFADQIF